MAKKDFSNIIPVFDDIERATAAAEATQDTQEAAQDTQDTQEAVEVVEIAEGAKKQRKDRKTYSEEEAAAALESMQTAGRKGVKLPRINLAFTPANYEFIKTMAQVRGQNLTEFVNEILAEARESHADIYEKAIEFRNSL